MIQADVNTKLDARTRLGVASGTPRKAAPQGAPHKPAASPLVYTAVLSAAYLLRRQLFSSGALLFAAGYFAARNAKTARLTNRMQGYMQGLVQEQATMTIDKPAEELYKQWQNVEAAPTYMESIRSVTRKGKNTSHWIMDLPGGRTLEWDAEWTAQEPGRRLAWHTVGAPAVPSAGQVVFEPAVNGRGTIVRVNQEFLLPGGKLAAALGGLFSRTPGGYVRENLRHFKQLAEAGEIATTRGQSHGSRSTGARLQQAVTGDREQQRTEPATGAIAHDRTPQEVAQ